MPLRQPVIAQTATEAAIPQDYPCRPWLDVARPKGKHVRTRMLMPVGLLFYGPAPQSVAHLGPPRFPAKY